MSFNKYDTIIIGAGLIGLSTAYHLKLKNPASKILVIEKEFKEACHQSSHNSGVLHSGIYYKPGSLKANNCIAGYHSLIEFAEENKIPYKICGKIIVASNASEIEALNRIYFLGVQNGLQNLKRLTKEEVRDIEPHCSGIAGIHVPQTGIIDYPKVAATLLSIFQYRYDGEIRFGEEVLNIETSQNIVRVKTTNEVYHATNLISCAGLFSDKVANLSERTNDLCIIPFRGEYYKLRKEKEYLVKGLIYPVPDLNFPFLGVHFTRMINGGIEAGPNAVLAFKREGYHFTDFSLKEFSDTLKWPGFWKLTAKNGIIGMGEIYRSLSKAAFTRALRKLIPEIVESDLIPIGAGVRAQACDRKGNLIDDFNILQRGNIIHVRNAPSPAATACLAIGKHIGSKVSG